MKKLLIIIPDQLSQIIEKGEIQPRYYNPGNLYEEVHILMTNPDQVLVEDLQYTVGNARIFIHTVPEPNSLIFQSPFFKPWLLKPWGKLLMPWALRYQRKTLETWAQNVLEIAKKVGPDLIRCHANDYNSFAASLIKRDLNIPYVVSLHINPDVNPRRRTLDPAAPWQDRLFARLFEDIEEIGLRNADLVLPVYKPIIPYLERLGISHYEVAYNVLSDRLVQKKSYELHQPVRLISIGRHFALKNPENIIRAVQDLPNTELTLVGSGSHQDYLVNLVRELKLEDRVIFMPAISNDNICEMLPEYDIFVIHTEHWELSKALLEALLTGLPVILNDRIGAGGHPPELEENSDLVIKTENTPEGYRKALQNLMDDAIKREQLGRQASEYAQKHWGPTVTEAKYVEIYQRVRKRKN